MLGTYFNEDPYYATTVSGFSPLTAEAGAATDFEFTLSACNATGEAAIDTVEVKFICVDDAGVTTETTVPATGTFPDYTVPATLAAGTCAAIIITSFSDGAPTTETVYDNEITVTTP